MREREKIGKSMEEKTKERIEVRENYRENER